MASRSALTTCGGANRLRLARANKKARAWSHWRGLLPLGICQCLFDELIQVSHPIIDFSIGCAFAVIRDNPNGWRALDSGANAEVVVGLDCGGELALRINSNRQNDAVTAGELLGKIAQHIQIVDRGLVGEDGVAVVVAEFFGSRIEPTGIDGGLKAPNVLTERKIVPEPGNLVLLGGLATYKVTKGCTSLDS